MHVVLSSTQIRPARESALDRLPLAQPLKEIAKRVASKMGFCEVRLSLGFFIQPEDGAALCAGEYLIRQLEWLACE